MTENLNDMLVSLAAFSRQLAQTVTNPGDGPFEGTDHTGAVTATFDKDATVARIEVADDWEELLDESADRLGQAVQQAWAMAAMRRSGLEPAEPGSAEPDPAAVEAIQAGQVPPLVVELTEADREEVNQRAQEQVALLESQAISLTVEEARDQVRQALERLDEVTKMMASVPTESTELVTQNRMIRIVLNPAGFVEACEIQANWVKSQSGKALTMAFGELIP